MKKLLKTLIIVMVAALVLVLAGAGAFVLLIGPWPVYSDANHRQARYFRQALADISQAVGELPQAAEATPLLAGWAEREITPGPGHPMAGYGGRPNNLRSTGVHEPLFVRALALNDGTKPVVFLGMDMLQAFPNLLEAVERRIQTAVGLTNHSVYYTSSHTHCGPGGLGPGVVAEMFMGPYDPAYLDHLAEQAAQAIIGAVASMAPARLAHGVVDVPEHIRNRSRRDGPVDSRMHFACVETLDGGQRLYMARYSAHSTVYSEEMLEFNNDYAGGFQRAVRERTGMPLLFMAGAVGAMRPHPPGPPVPEPWTEALEMGFENDVESTLVRQGRKTLEEMLRDQELRVEAMGQALTDRLLDAVETAAFEDRARIRAIAVTYSPPPAQVRPVSTKWRLSPFAFNLLGVPKEGRLQAVSINDCFLIGMPYDFGGEVSLAWQEWAASRDAMLWVTSFSGAYLGYLSPDKYYLELGDHLPYNHNYEIGQMNWFGPNQEAFSTDLFQHAFAEMLPEKTK